MKKINVGILGATGAVGQRFVELLANHPWFKITEVCASERSSGKKYKDVVSWKMATPIPKDVENLVIKLCEPQKSTNVYFSALDSEVAGEIEEKFAKAGKVIISNSKNHRMVKDVPLLIPEVNPDHIGLIDFQRKRFKRGGFIVTNPNCTTTGLVMVLKPLHAKFGLKKVIVTTMQALSGAGYPGVASLDALDNVIPYIGGEEEKMEAEPLKLLGKFADGGEISYAKFKVSAQCNRVGVRDGHTESVTLEFEKKPKIENVIETLEKFKSVPQKLKLPSAPEFPIVYTTEINRPQPVLDRNLGRGMTVVVGRIGESNIFDIKLTLLVHNTIRGAAGGAILNAELLKAKGYI